MSAVLCYGVLMVLSKIAISAFLISLSCSASCVVCKDFCSCRIKAFCARSLFDSAGSLFRAELIVVMVESSGSRASTIGVNVVAFCRSIVVLWMSDDSI